MTDALGTTATVERVTITETDDGRYQVTVNRRRNRRPPHNASLMFMLSAVELAYLEAAAEQILRPQLPLPEIFREKRTPTTTQDRRLTEG
ncbi:MAG TPA: hypothetical protein VIV08_02625 [Acidimicrobiia bacterium]